MWDPTWLTEAQLLSTVAEAWHFSTVAEAWLLSTLTPQLITHPIHQLHAARGVQEELLTSGTFLVLAELWLVNLHATTISISEPAS